MKKNLGHRSQASSYDTRKGQQILSTKISYKNGQNSQQATILGPWRLTESKQHIEKHLILKNSHGVAEEKTNTELTIRKPPLEFSLELDLDQVNLFDHQCSYLN